MSSKTKAARLEQKKYWETKLEERLNFLKDNGVAPQKAAKDPAVRKLRAKIRETEARLQAIEALEKKKEEMAKRKAEKLAKPKKEKEKKKKKEEQKQEISKRQLKKQKKKEGKKKA